MRMLTIATLGLAVAATSAYAHGTASWIMDSPTTKHCCGPTDCAMEMSDDVVADDGGWYVKSTRQHFRDTDPEIYPSIDNHIWTCRKFTSIEDMKDGFRQVRCLFVPVQS